MHSYLTAQIEAGAEVVQMFDTWASLLSRDQFTRWALPAAREALAGLGVPTIYFAPGAAHLVDLFHLVGATAYGVDWRLPLGDAWLKLGERFPIQGNLDPALLLSDPDTVRSGTVRVLEEAAGRPGHIFNLGHGVLPDTPHRQCRSHGEHGRRMEPEWCRRRVERSTGDTMSAPETLDGWFALHDLRRFDRVAWNLLSAATRKKALTEATDLLTSFEQVEDAPAGRSVTYSVIGHKADLLMFHLRPEVGELHELERAFDDTLLATCTTRPYSYLSVVEISRHGSPEGTSANIEDSPAVQARLYPEIPPHSRYVCFYPMSKKREGTDNWYTLSAADRGGSCGRMGAPPAATQGR